MSRLTNTSFGIRFRKSRLECKPTTGHVKKRKQQKSKFQVNEIDNEFNQLNHVFAENIIIENNEKVRKEDPCFKGNSLNN